MKHGLSGIPADIRHDSVSRLRETMPMRQFFTKQQEPRQQVAILIRKIPKRRNMTFWYHQQMDRRLGINVPKCQGLIVLKQDIGRNGSFDDPAEETGTHNTPPFDHVERIPDLPYRPANSAHTSLMVMS